MDQTEHFFDTEQQGDTLVVTPAANLGELDTARIDDGMKCILGLLDPKSVKNLILDFHKTDYFGSSALGMFVRLWKTVSAGNGRMVFCNLSEHEKEVLQVTKLDQLWDICNSRDDALQVVKK
jgi:anti-anti-sigma factor